jgi:hypothetical protein
MLPLACAAPAFGLTTAIQLVLTTRRDQTGGDLLLQRARLGDKRIQAAKQGSEFIRGEKALLAHTTDGRITVFMGLEQQDRFLSGRSSVSFAVSPASRLRCHRPEGDSMRVEERRNIPARAAVVQRVINGVVQNPSVTLSVDTLQAWLDIPFEAADRILHRLASSGLVREVQKGVWARGTWPGAQRDWY